MADRSSTDTFERTRRRFARRQRAGRRRRWLTALVVAVALALVVGVTWLVFFSERLAVQGVEVRGTESLSAGEVRSAADVPTGEPLATLDLAAIEARIETLAAVREVDVSRQWPDSVLVVVEERVPVAVVSIGGEFRGLDAEGVVFDRFRRAPAGLPRVEVTADVADDALVEAAAVVAALPADLAARVDHVEVRTVDQVTLELHDGRTVRWGSAEDSEQKAEVLAGLLEAQQAPIYDVSAPGQPTVCTQPAVCGDS
ncbi:FtsQ-type POTRA domain-containing protein [Nocardioides sp. zg-579]|uniref:Cell division protein FtsQ n=1 Tax=Nocardioides marmotae TaxID=2663857 RepID=A0A6I3JC30_9ACTN|nr:FtsQ-type POTRA domain-containing protein [Nocardioides marmotae]MCR6031972.1 FtsQ-type POTRA domain-containing protein [Gordonia jinghuaiqii]MTB95613.1 FtsQ-type POTRA domain-containing protein [Nocardioides marmotae]QKE01030.1 FtsQ-type POTRA domain-containing protein [Nocardioides marmotae]